MLSLRAYKEDSGPKSHVSDFGLTSLSVDTNGDSSSAPGDDHLGKQDTYPESRKSGSIGLQGAEQQREIWPKARV